MSSWVRGNLLIPDPRVFWVTPASKVLKNLIESRDIDKVITTGPPHSIHLIGLKIKKKFPAVKWIVDLRDPWSEWDLLDTLLLTDAARERHRKLERRVLQNADRVITIAPFHVTQFERLGGRKVDLITNGFDTDDFEKVQRTKTAKFTIRHTGVVDELRDPRPFMLALREIFETTPDMQVVVEFIGNVNSAFKEFVKEDIILSSFTKFTNTIPHKELLQLYGQTDLLLLILAHTALAPGNLPGKLFEYLASGIQIMAVGPVMGDAADVIHQAKAGEIFERNDEAAMVSMLRRQYDLWRSGSVVSTTDATPFTRKKLTDQLISLITSL